jgi:hypothetical protein
MIACKQVSETARALHPSIFAQPAFIDFFNNLLEKEYTYMRQEASTCPLKTISCHLTIIDSIQAPPGPACPADIRRTIYEANVIESLNNSLKKTLINRASFTHDEAALHLLNLSLKNSMKKWTMPVRNRGAALNQAAVLSDNRMRVS